MLQSTTNPALQACAAQPCRSLAISLVSSPNNSPAGTGHSTPGTAAAIVLFEADHPHGNGTVLSTFDEHFTSTCSLSSTGLAGGVSSKVQRLVPGYSTSFMLASGSGGVTNIVMSWGHALQRAHNTSRALAATDVVTTKLGYWTDNEAYYDWYHWFPNVSREGKPQDVLLALKRELEGKGLPIAYWQLDAYWYKLEIAPGCCIVDWQAVPDQFPRGLAWLSKQLDAPMLL